MSLPEQIQLEVLKLEGPIVIFGAGGFIGANLMRTILNYRNDVFAVTSKPFIPWRLEDINPKNILHCNITKKDQIDAIFKQHQFKSIFDLAAYGAYSKQDKIELTYETNIMGLLNLLEISSQFSIKSFVHAGSSSEYGLNAAAPKEEDFLQPNSHYAVTKASAAQH